MNYVLRDTKITKAMLKSHRSEEEYMSFYLGILPDKSLHVNPLRPDNRPTASFYRSASEELIFKDWKTGVHANFIDIVMEKYNVQYPQALDLIAEDFGLLPKTRTKRSPLIQYDGSKVVHKSGAQLQCEIQDFTPTQYKWWNNFGITQKTLKLYKVFSVKSVFINGNYSCSSSNLSPIYGYYFGKDMGRELWKIYFPKRKNYRFLLNNNKLQGYSQLPETGDILVITKSLKDVMTFHEMGIPAVAPQAESVIISQKQYDILSKRFKHIVFNGDWDRAGQMFMINSRKKYKGVALTFTKPIRFGKDVSDFVKHHGFKKAKRYIDIVKSHVLKGSFDKQHKYCKAA